MFRIRQTLKYLKKSAVFNVALWYLVYKIKLKIENIIKKKRNCAYTFIYNVYKI